MSAPLPADQDIHDDGQYSRTERVWCHYPRRGPPRVYVGKQGAVLFDGKHALPRGAANDGV